jgi:16S rRNA C967 or C1407 C5-methylase (RsmB/RsmF family)/NOL1/NOP2/fmu family ribosome biogenesis protein
MTNVFPEAFAQRMKASLPSEEWNQFVDVHGDPPPVSIRINPGKNHPEISQVVPWSQYGRYLNARPTFTLDPTFHAGAYYVQEASSMFLEQAFVQHVPPTSRLRVLDLCASPGGKSTHILSLINEECLLVSNEVIRSRVNPLLENVQKWGYHNTVITNNDASDFQALPGFFDVIVVDAPCSGEGLFRKDPGAMLEWSERNAELCSARQKRILEDVWPALKQNGILVYSTCTYNACENELNLLSFAETHGVEFLALNVPEHWNVTEIQNNPVTGYQLFPHKVSGEGFFLSVMRKTEPQQEISVRQTTKAFSYPAKSTTEEVRNWVIPGDYNFIQRNETIQLLPASHFESIGLITQKLRVFYSGIFMAVKKHDKLIPDHTLALAVLLNKNRFHAVELDESDAIRYLRKDNLTISTDQKGFALATYKNLPIGWMNVLAGRINNLYPSEWRIRMR